MAQLGDDIELVMKKIEDLGGTTTPSPLLRRGPYLFGSAIWIE